MGSRWAGRIKWLSVLETALLRAPSLLAGLLVPKPRRPHHPQAAISGPRWVSDAACASGSLAKPCHSKPSSPGRARDELSGSRLVWAAWVWVGYGRVGQTRRARLTAYSFHPHHHFVRLFAAQIPRPTRRLPW